MFLFMCMLSLENNQSQPPVAQHNLGCRVLPAFIKCIQINVMNTIINSKELHNILRLIVEWLKSGRTISYLFIFTLILSSKARCLVACF